MRSKRISRREFMMGCSAAIAAMAGARLSQVAIAAPDGSQADNQDILVVVFLRGGWDALNVVAPIAGTDRGLYEAARAELQIPASGAGGLLALNAQFGIHPAMAALHDLFQANRLAIVHAAGLTSDTRSHFDAMQFMEMGTPDMKSTPNGWLTRHLASANNLPGGILIPALSAGDGLAGSLIGNRDAVAMYSPDSFNFDGHWFYETRQRSALRKIYNGDTWLYQSGVRTLDAVDLIEGLAPGDYVPANGAVYPDNTFGNHLQTVAQMIKLGIGLRIATVDLGGWDTHEYQGDGSGGYMADLLSDLSDGLAAFYTDLDGAGNENYINRTTVVVKSEFGRRLRENASRGTDHGHGSVMMVLGGQVNGGQIYGQWPGLSAEQLYDYADLEVTTDYRQVLSEILIRRLGNANLPFIFPGYSGYSPLNIVQGADLPIPTPGDFRLNLPMNMRG